MSDAFLQLLAVCVVALFAIQAVSVHALVKLCLTGQSLIERRADEERELRRVK